MRMPGVKEQVEGINNQGRVMQQMQGGSIPSAGGYNQGGQIPFLAAPRMNLPQYQDAGGFIGDLLAGGLLQNVFNQAPEQPPVYSHAAEVIARRKAEELAKQQAQHRDDGGWITDSLLDKLREVESGGDNEAVSPVGAIGAYQWLPKSAAQAGYGVKAFDPKNEKEARAATAKYLKNMQKHHGFTPEETLRAYNWGPGNVIKHKKGTRKDIPDEALNYPGKILGIENTQGVPAPAGMPVPIARPGSIQPEAIPTPTARPEGLGIPTPTPRPQEESPMWKSFLNDYILGEKTKFDNGGEVKSNFLDRVYGEGANNPGGNIVAPLTDVPKGHVMFGGDQNIGGEKVVPPAETNNVIPQVDDLSGSTTGGIAKESAGAGEVPWYSALLGPKSKAALDIPLEESDKAFIDKQTATNEKLASPEIAEEENQIADGFVDTENTNATSEDDLINQEKEKVAESTVTEDKASGDLKKKIVDKINLKANQDANSTGPGGDQKGPNVSDEKVVEAGTQDPSGVEKAGNFLKSVFGDLFDAKELGRMAIMYAGSRALGYNHSGSMQFAAKQYVNRVDAKASAKVAAAATQEKRAYELAKTDKFTPGSVSAYRKSGNPADLVSKTAVAGAVPTGTTEQRLIDGKKVSVQQVKLPSGAVGYQIPGKGVITKAQLENHSKAYDASFDKGTSEYRTRRARAVKSAEGLFKDIQEREGTYKVGDEKKYSTGIIPAQAAQDFWTFAEKYGIDPESDEAQDLMGSAYRQAIIQSKVKDAPVSKNLKNHLEAMYIRQQTSAPQLFQVNPDKDAKEDAQYIRSDKMRELTSLIDSVGGNLPGVKRNQIIDSLVTDWGALGADGQKSWNRKANDGTETGFYLYAKERSHQYLTEKKVGE